MWTNPKAISFLNNILFRFLSATAENGDIWNQKNVFSMALRWCIFIRHRLATLINNGRLVFFVQSVSRNKRLIVTEYESRSVED